MAALVSARPMRGFPTRWIVVGVGAALIATTVALVGTGTLGGNAPRAVATATVSSGSITASVAGIGTVAAAQTLDLAFTGSGNVSEVLVQAGDTVTAGQPIARLDDRALRSQAANAQAEVAAAQARLDQTTAGNAKPDDLAAARAQLASAQASYDKVAAGPSAADISSTQASLASSEANLKDVLAGPTASDVAAARATVRSAESQLATAQKGLADLQAQPHPADIQAAQLSVNQAKDSLWAQQLSRDATCGRSGPTSGDCKSGNASVAAQETAVSSAEVKLAQAQERPTAETMVAAQQAVGSANASLTSANAALAKLQAGPTAANRQSAQSQVDEATASLVKAQTSVTATDLASAQAAVDQARANLDKLTAPSTASDVSIQQAGLIQAEETLKQAQLTLDNATLKAPFAGVIGSVNVVPGSSVGGSTVVARVIDRSTLHVDLKLSENDVVKVAVGQPATLTSDSLPGWTAPGRVSYIAPAAETTNGVATYAVQATFDGASADLRVGMTANVTITTSHKDGVLLVPNSALLPKGAGHIVQRVGADSAAPQDVDVQVGVSDGASTEIISGVREGDHIVALPVTAAPRSGGGLFG